MTAECVISSEKFLFHIFLHHDQSEQVANYKETLSTKLKRKGKIILNSLPM